MSVRRAAESAGQVLLATVANAAIGVTPLLELVGDDGVGGTAAFVGTVRDVDEARVVTALSYSAHPGAQQVMAAVAAEVAAAYPGVRLAVTHRVGDLVVGDVAIVAVAGAAHRDVAFLAARELVDRVKAEVPIWKQQRFADGGEHWVGLPSG